MTDCTQPNFAFQAIGGRRVEMDFLGGEVTSDAGTLLLGEVDRARNVLARLASHCFVDGRDQRFVDHSLDSLLASVRSPFH